MYTTAPHWLRHLLVIIGAVALIAGCANETPVAPNAQLEFPSAVSSASRNHNQAEDLGVCEDLQAPVGSQLALHVYAKGVQIHRWNGTSWVFVAPLATLSADAEGRSTFGIHYAGPTWETNSGGKVVGTVLKRCTPNPNAIPWLSLGVVSNEGHGVFNRVTSIQRVNTVGGNAPSSPGSFVGEEARVTYSAEYLFYRMK